MTAEIFFTNSLFFLLFLSTILNAKFDIQLESPTLKIFSNRRVYPVGISTFLLTAFLSLRWFESGHPPLSNLYESLLFLTWTLLVFYMVLFYGSSQESPEKQLSLSAQLTYFILIAASLFIYTFAQWRLPSEMQQISPLVPALQSNWLLMHVSIMLLSYGALLGGSLFSIAYLIIDFIAHKRQRGDLNHLFLLTKKQNQQSPYFQENKTINLESTAALSSDSQDQISNSMVFESILNRLDGLSSQTLSFAFPLLTLGILSGAVWANEAWGSYWSWDPKETWALITWFVFSIYLHVRLNKGWSGAKAAWVSTAGFFVVWICYLGVNLLGKGLHSYGWFAN
jgi:cytochrome c-type biogenesis protein CcsB